MAHKCVPVTGNIKMKLTRTAGLSRGFSHTSMIEWGQPFPIALLKYRTSVNSAHFAHVAGEAEDKSHSRDTRQQLWCHETQS